jgi:drug/metabolite transporter (DMT)-like permease
MALPGRRTPSVWLYVLYTGVAWGSASLISKALIDDGVHPLVVTGVPFLIGGIIALWIAMRSGHLTRAAVPPAAVLGVLSTATPALCFNVGFTDLPAGIVTLLISVSPVFTAIAAHFAFADEPFRPAKGAGLALAVAGVAALSLAPGSMDEGANAGAIAVVLLGTLFGGVMAVPSRRYAVRHGAAALVPVQLLAAGVAALALVPFVADGAGPSGGFGLGHVLGLTTIGTVASYGGFRSIMRANELGTTGQVSVVGYMLPLLGVVGGIVFFGERLTVGVAAGGVLIVLAVGLIARASVTPAVAVER